MKFCLHHILFVLILSACNIVSAQSYTSYYTGEEGDTEVNTEFGICLMGGAGEHDEASKWFLNKAQGGNILVLRATGEDGYNNYFYSELGISVHSVETIVFHNAEASQDEYVLQQIRNAEAIWFAGGDQATYIDYWKDTEIEVILTNHVNVENKPVGGTSAGMAILGGRYFSAENGSITSIQALNNPYNDRIQIGNQDFLMLNYLEDVITDTHYDNPDRKGRHTTFLARITQDYQKRAFGIACDEYTSVCIDADGKGYVYGEYPSYDDNAWFIQTNCLTPFTPETIEDGIALTWNNNSQAVKAYNIKGTMEGQNYFDLSTWENGVGGVWMNFWVENGEFFEGSSTEIDCDETSILENELSPYKIWPNPCSDQLKIELEENDYQIRLLNLHGHPLFEGDNTKILDVGIFPKGSYLLEIKLNDSRIIENIVII